MYFSRVIGINILSSVASCFYRYSVVISVIYKHFLASSFGKMMFKHVAKINNYNETNKLYKEKIQKQAVLFMEKSFFLHNYNHLSKDYRSNTKIFFNVNGFAWLYYINNVSCCFLYFSVLISLINCNFYILFYQNVWYKEKSVYLCASKSEKSFQKDHFTILLMIELATHKKRDEF